MGPGETDLLAAITTTVKLSRRVDLPCVRGRARVRARRNGRRLTASASTHAEHGTLDDDDNATDGTVMGNVGLTELAERAGADNTRNARQMASSGRVEDVLAIKR